LQGSSLEDFSATTLGKTGEHDGAVSRSRALTATAASTTTEDGDRLISEGKAALNDGSTIIANKLPACRCPIDFNSSPNILNFIIAPAVL